LRVSEARGTKQRESSEPITLHYAAAARAPAIIHSSATPRHSNRPEKRRRGTETKTKTGSAVGHVAGAASALLGHVYLCCLSPLRHKTPTTTTTTTTTTTHDPASREQGCIPRSVYGLVQLDAPRRVECLPMTSLHRKLNDFGGSSSCVCSSWSPSWYCTPSTATLNETLLLDFLHHVQQASEHPSELWFRNIAADIA
jgi:hypothetical protein